VPGIGGTPGIDYRVVEGQIPEDLKTCLVQPFSEEEIREIHHSVDLFAAESNHEKPVALWLFGPPAVGKSSMSLELGPAFFGGTNSAVSVDGSEFRNIHKGFQMVAQHGLRNKLLHADAWKLLKKTGCMDKLKMEIVELSVKSRQHLKIPEAGLNMERVYTMMDQLVSAGYEMHVVCLWAPRKAVEQRGRPRSVMEGKYFNTKTYDQAVENSLALAHVWRQRSAEDHQHYKSSAFYDTTVFPSRPVDFAEFEMLARMDDTKSAEHMLRWTAVQRIDKPVKAKTSFQDQTLSHVALAESCPNQIASAQQRGRVEGFILGVAVPLILAAFRLCGFGVDVQPC
jgi:hypothetical protein